MSNKRFQSYKKKTKKKSRQKKMQKNVAVQSGKNPIDAPQKFVTISIEEVLDRIAAYERKGDITHEQAFEAAERYVNIKPGEVVVPKEVYDSWS